MNREKLFDMDGNEVKVGHILENPNFPEDFSDRYHIVFLDRDKELEIRDLGANNLGIYNIHPFRIKGYFWQFPDLFDDEDLAWHFGMDRELAEIIRCKFEENDNV